MITNKQNNKTKKIKGGYYVEVTVITLILFIVGLITSVLYYNYDDIGNISSSMFSRPKQIKTQEETDIEMTEDLTENKEYLTENNEYKRDTRDFSDKIETTTEPVKIEYHSRPFWLSWPFSSNKQHISQSPTDTNSSTTAGESNDLHADAKGDAVQNYNPVEVKVQDDAGAGEPKYKHVETDAAAAQEQEAIAIILFMIIEEEKEKKNTVSPAPRSPTPTLAEKQEAIAIILFMIIEAEK